MVITDYDKKTTMKGVEQLPPTKQLFVNPNLCMLKVRNTCFSLEISKKENKK